MAQGQIIGFTGFQPPSGTVGDDAMNANSPAGVTKTRHLHSKGTSFGLAIGATPVTGEFQIYRAKAAGTIRNFVAELEETGSSSSIAFDLKKYNDANPTGVSVLSSAVTITNATADRSGQAGTISSATYSVGDIFTISMTVSSSTGATGPWADAEFDEPAS